MKKPCLGSITQPELIDKANELALLMKSKSIQDMASLMDLSDDLSLLNYERFQQFDLSTQAFERLYPALFLFQGDVYQGLDALTWHADAIEFSKSHLGILSGLYGLLSPMDGIQPYRLEMGVKLLNSCGPHLYDFWQNAVTQSINKRLSSHRLPILINLASVEYFKVVNQNALNYPVVTINFYEQKNGVLKMVGIYAKKARGMMGKYIMQNAIDDLERIKHFNESGYQFNPASSSANHFDFIRKSL